MDCIGADLPMRNEEHSGDNFDTRTFTSIVRILLTVEATEKTSSLDIKQRGTHTGRASNYFSQPTNTRWYVRARPGGPGAEIGRREAEAEKDY